MRPRKQHRTPTLEDVARVAGVSRATVSRVVNGVATVDAALRLKVMAAVDTTGYRPNNAARQLAGRKAGSIALVISGSDGSAEQVFGDPFFGRVTGGVVKHLRTKGIHPTLVLADSESARGEAVDYVRRGNADGALLVSTHADDTLPGLFVDAGLPAVLFARPALHAPISYVDLAHEVGAALAADRLVARGCRRVATIAGPIDVPAAQDRLSGFRQAMARHGEPYAAVAYGNFTLESGELAMADLLARTPDLDGVFAANDLMAAGALRALRDAGRAVPADVAVIGFDDSAPASTSTPRLTTVAQPLEEMAAEMSRLLLDQITHAGTEPVCKIFDPHLVLRDSA
ncbi:transcriptional regulator, LacI family [Kribbella flavida DSM 17836]|uniref:Transcriptional regulator, LacI family n=1 Tax=Kribbella flavida (strain DSM 17836 / JCM 10339 / NBRC 14399) TaxID=479435 RepID=D2PU22_KRIFD|nr:LacI family DNA-binding transcriptional regulator [Kribbella flavida]ADB33305.1 transcriptional regulator, LacI family [Kribbella flavida DSM 17836]